MTGSAPSAPAPPDPVATAQAQGAMNADTARLTAQLNRVNQVGPNGSITYSQAPGGTKFDQAGYDKALAQAQQERGTSSSQMIDPGGGAAAYESQTIKPGTLSDQETADLRAKYTTSTPSDSWTQTTTLSPAQQQLQDLSQQAQTTYGQAANQQLQQVKGILSQPFSGQPYTDYTNQALGATSAATQRALAASQQPWNDPGAAASAGALSGVQGAAGAGAAAAQQPWNDPSSMAAQQALMQGQSAAARVSGLAGAPINTDYNAVRQQSIDAANSRLQPQFQQQEDQLRTRLLNSGITEGSEAWNRSYQQMNQAQNDSRQQSILNAENLTGQAINQTGALRQIPINELAQASSIYGNLTNQSGATQGQAITSRQVPLQEAGQVAALYGAQGQEASRAAAQAAQSRAIPLNEAQQIASLGTAQGNQSNQALQQALALRTQPLNEAAALLNGSAVQSPVLQNSPQVNVAPTDYLGAVGQNYQGQLANYNSQMQQQNASMGGLFGLAGTVGGAALKYGPQLATLFSDRRLKTDIQRVGKTDAGLPVYTYKYKAGGPTQMGVMAQDVQKKSPDAVHNIGGMLAVDYGMVG